MSFPTDYQFAGFGDNPATSVKFTFLRNRDGSVPDWRGGPRVVQEPVATSPSRVITQMIGRTPYTITMRLRFATVAEYERFDAMQGLPRQTLRYQWNITKTIGGAYERHTDGKDYLALSDVLLVSIDDAEIHRRGVVTATATFQRAYHDPTPRTYGPYPAAPDPEAT